VFHTQAGLQGCFHGRHPDAVDFIAVGALSGTEGHGNAELHQADPPLGVLQDRGQKVALVN